MQRNLLQAQRASGGCSLAHGPGTNAGNKSTSRHSVKDPDSSPKAHLVLVVQRLPGGGINVQLNEDGREAPLLQPPGAVPA